VPCLSQNALDLYEIYLHCVQPRHSIAAYNLAQATGT